MPGSSPNASFIPKRGTAKRSRRRLKGQVYLLTIVSYVMLFATLLATAGVFVYGKVVEQQLQNEITAFNNEIADFNEADLLRVQAFDRRLAMAAQRIENSASVVSVLNAVERATIGTVQFNAFNLQREDDTSYSAVVDIQTDSFDSTIFQRGVFTRHIAGVSDVNIEDLQLRGGDGSVTVSSGAVSTNPEFSRVSFRADITLPLTAVPYNPSPTTQQANTQLRQDTPSVESGNVSSSSVNDLSNELSS